MKISVPTKLSIIPEHYTNLLKMANDLALSVHEDSVLHFTDNHWIYPCGIVLLAQYSIRYKKNGQNLSVSNMPAYLKTSVRDNLDSVFGVETICEPHLTEQASESILSFLHNHGAFEECFLDMAIQENIDEMISNGLQHSGTKSVSVFGQYYKSRKELIFSIMDIGIGIPEHIRQKYPAKDFPEFLDDSWCIMKATEQGVTGSNYSKNSGIGLFDLKDWMESSKNNLRIISGTGYYENLAGTERRTTLPIKFQGTVIDFQLFLNNVSNAKAKAKKEIFLF